MFTVSTPIESKSTFTLHSIPVTPVQWNVTHGYLNSAVIKVLQKATDFTLPPLISLFLIGSAQIFLCVYLRKLWYKFEVLSFISQVSYISLDLVIQCISNPSNKQFVFFFNPFIFTPFFFTQVCKTTSISRKKKN